jgi:hypothetical protein
MRAHSSSLTVALVLILLTVGYGVFQARTLIVGPTLVVHEPRPGKTLTNTLMEVRGTATNVTHITVNGRPATFDLSGNFKETLLTPEGYGTILIEAENRFGRKVSTQVDIMGAPPVPTSTDDIIFDS